MWEADQSSSHPSSYHGPPELDLNIMVPCELDMARKYLLERKLLPQNASNDGRNNECSCRLREIITYDLLIFLMKEFYDDEFDLATHPVILRHIWPPESFVGGNSGRRRLAPNAILNDPQLSNLLLPNYFSDATKTGYDALVPDQNQITLSQFLRGILSGETPNAKIGTQVIVEQYPELRDEIVPSTLAKELFGWNTWLEDGKERIKTRLGWMIGGMIEKLPAMSTFPVFIASNQNNAAEPFDAHPRTDLHAEPIGNIASQLHGTRHWTLVPTKYSGLLRPTVSRHRGYFYSNMDPLTELPKRLDSLPLVYKCITRVGDAVWVPPWVWHRIDYNDDKGDESALPTDASDGNLSVGASIFHFYPTLFVKNFPLFSFLIIPNLIMEVLGFNIE
ncbi:hypothetical protein ACHAXR_011809 [Thalassiosira sp. AJA248-18]